MKTTVIGIIAQGTLRPEHKLRDCHLITGVHWWRKFQLFAELRQDLRRFLRISPGIVTGSTMKGSKFTALLRCRKHYITDITRY